MHMKQYDLNKVSDYINVSFLVVISYYYEMLPLGESGEGVYRISLIISYNRLSVYNYLRIKSFFKKTNIQIHKGLQKPTLCGSELPVTRGKQVKTKATIG